MGLDMGLSKKVVEDHDLVYWRKANQIREWFVNNLENFQDEGETKVTEQNIKDLLEVCKEVQANHDKAPELLPVSEGFFFGSDEYDEWYFDQIDETVEELEQVLENTDWEKEEIFYWEWY